LFVFGKKMPNPMPTDHIICDINYSETDASFPLLANRLGGIHQNNALCFDNDILKGEIIKSDADKGLYIRKWKFITHTNILIRKSGSADTRERKFLLYYFLHPTIFKLKNQKKKFRVSGSRNNIFLADGKTIEFQLGPKESFYVFEIMFTAQWLMEQLTDADPLVRSTLAQYILKSAKIEPFTLSEYQTLHELEVCMLIDHSEDFFIRSRAYNLIVGFFSKIINRKESKIIQTSIEYDQLIEAETLIMENIEKPMSIATIAKRVNMSVATLVRKFKLIHGKNIHEYYVEKKMELAKRMILEHDINVKQMAAILGYKQVSAFIETFAKQFGYTPGNLKSVSKKFSFF
jgi:AraC-like DNA-binding protein